MARKWSKSMLIITNMLERETKEISKFEVYFRDKSLTCKIGIIGIEDGRS